MYMCIYIFRKICKNLLTLVSSEKGKEVDGMDTEFLLQYFNFMPSILQN